MRRALAVAVIGALGCGGHDAAPPAPAPPPPSAARAVVDAGLELPPLALGLPTLEAYAWRKRAGQPAFRLARKAEAREDWARVVPACRDALAADPGHLEAAWLLAVALAKVGQTGEVLAPLTVAVAGDPGKWGPASLEQPALAAFRATAEGAAWQRRLEVDRRRYAEALARAVLVMAGGELYAYDAQGPRWYRVTRTYGAVIGALPVPAAHLLYYVTTRGGTLQAGVVQMATGHSSRPQELGTAGPITLARSDGDPPGAWIAQGAAAARTWRQLDDEGFLHPLPPRAARPRGPWLEVLGRTARVHRLPIEGITADWDERGLASAVRIARSNRVVTVPTGQIDGDTVAWSPDHAHLALVAVLDERCTPGAPAAAAYVVDAATGALTELARGAGGVSIDWLGDRTLAIAADAGVSLVDLGGAPPVALPGAVELLARKRRARCTPDEAPAEVPDVDEEVEIPGDAGSAATPR